MHKKLSFAILLLGSTSFATDVTVDAAHTRRAINPEVYGVMLGDDAQLGRMGVTVRRHGGNGLERFNWKTSTTNTGGDGKFFQKRSSTPSDDFVRATKAAGAAAMIELPMTGYVSTEMSAPPAHCGFRVSAYGPQEKVDPADPDCGNGVGTDGKLMSGNPLDTSLAVDDAWNKEWVSHLVSTFGNAQSGGVKYYNLGNQPALWSETHRDVHPAKATYAEIKQKLEANGKAVKEADQSAMTLGPGAWGWLEYFDSAAGDRAATGVDFIPFYLQTAKTYEAVNGTRILDYLDVHVYPQAEGIAGGATTDDANAMRLRSTKILWDPTYVVESWETCCNGNGGILKIVPRMKEWIGQNYPGTKLAISGYGFGAIDTTNGALTEVDVLGIMGREGVDLATLEEPPKADSIGEDAFKLFRNYDGQGAKFGDTSVKTDVPSPDSLSAYSSFDAAGKVTVVLVNKDPQSAQNAVIKFKGMGASGPYRAFEFGANGRLAASGTGNISDGSLTRSIPAYTATLVEFVPQGGIGASANDEPVDPSMPKVQPNKMCAATPADAMLLLGLLPLLALRRRAKK
jgi:hypothetical protein